MAKIAATPSIVIAEFVFFKKRVSFQKVVALCSFHRCCSGYVNDLQFHFFGACIALAWIVPSAVNKILWSNMQQQEKWTAPAAASAVTHVVLGQFKT
ncbi:Nucleotide-sugar putative transporter 1-like protein [Drosera capensis]